MTQTENKPYYIIHTVWNDNYESKNEWLELTADCGIQPLEPIEACPEIEFFCHRGATTHGPCPDDEDGLAQWVVTEARSGCMAYKDYGTRQEIIDNAIGFIAKAGAKKVRQSQTKAIAMYGLSPRYSEN